MAGASGSRLSRGGMVTKIEAGKIATNAGTHMVIASGKTLHPLRAIADGARCTWFLTPANPVYCAQEMDRRLARAEGILHIDAGAVAALRRGASLLPAGVKRCDGASSAATRGGHPLASTVSRSAAGSLLTPPTRRRLSANPRRKSSMFWASPAAPRSYIATISCSRARDFCNRD